MGRLEQDRICTALARLLLEIPAMGRDRSLYTSRPFKLTESRQRCRCSSPGSPSVLLCWATEAGEQAHPRERGKRQSRIPRSHLRCPSSVLAQDGKARGLVGMTNSQSVDGAQQGSMGQGSCYNHPAAPDSTSLVCVAGHRCAGGPMRNNLPTPSPRLAHGSLAEPLVGVPGQGLDGQITRTPISHRRRGSGRTLQTPQL